MKLKVVSIGKYSNEQTQIKKVYYCLIELSTLEFFSFLQYNHHVKLMCATFGTCDVF